VGTLPPGNLNLPTFSTDVPGSIVLKRRVRNVGRAAAVYTATVSVPGFTATVTPASLSLGKGESGSYTVTLKTNGAAIGSRVSGSLVWKDGVHTVTSPVLARATLLSAPGLVSSTAATGTSKFKVNYGFDGATSALVTGLKAATRTPGSVALDNSSCFTIAVPADALVVRAALYDADTSGNGGDDLDLELYNGAGTLVAASGGATANELVSVKAPAAGNYQACVIGYNPVGGTSNFTLSSWVLSPADVGGSLKLKGLPTTVAVGDVGTANASWSGLSAQRYLGGIRYAKADGATVGMTLLSVEPGASSLTQRDAEVTSSKLRSAAAR